MWALLEVKDLVEAVWLWLGESVDQILAELYALSQDQAQLCQVVVLLMCWVVLERVVALFWWEVVWRLHLAVAEFLFVVVTAVLGLRAQCPLSLALLAKHLVPTWWLQVARVLVLLVAHWFSRLVKVQPAEMLQSMVAWECPAMQEVWLFVVRLVLLGDLVVMWSSLAAGPVLDLVDRSFSRLALPLVE
jgi:hypothetical protein